MKNGTCPVCGSNEIYISDFAPLQAGDNRLRIFSPKGNDFPLEIFLCANCGHLELSIAAGHTGRIAELTQTDKWKKVARLVS